MDGGIKDVEGCYFRMMPAFRMKQFYIYYDNDVG